MTEKSAKERTSAAPDAYDVKLPRLSAGVCISSPTLVSDMYGDLWWVDPAAQVLRRVTAA